MSERDDLLRHAYDRPDDDGPRLVLADCLDEHGETERAELIRLQVARARREAGGVFGPPEVREVVLADAEESRLRATPAGKDGVQFARPERGLPPRVTFRHLKTFRAHADAVFAELPGVVARVDHLTPQTARQLARLPQLALAGGLEVGDPRAGPAGLAALLASPHLAAMHSLALSGHRVTQAVVEAVARLSALRRLRLDMNPPGDDGLRALASAAPPSLEVLSLRGCGITAGGVAALAAPHALPGLRELHLDGNAVGGAGAAALLRRPGLRVLSLHGALLGCGPFAPAAPTPVEKPGEPLVLYLGANSLTDDHLAALATWPGLERVGRVHLHDNHFGADGLCSLAASPRLAGLARLHLGDTPTHPRGLEAVLRSPHAPRLTFVRSPRLKLTGPETPPTPDAPALPAAVELRLPDGNGITPDAAEWLAGSGCLARLRELHVGYLQHGPGRVVAALLRSPHLSGLEALSAGGDRPGREAAEAVIAADLPRLRSLTLAGLVNDAGARALADAPRLAGLAAVDLRRNPIGPAAAAALRGRFGDRVLLDEGVPSR